jgi:hypothetical protein
MYVLEEGDRLPDRQLTLIAASSQSIENPSRRGNRAFSS